MDKVPFRRQPVDPAQLGPGDIEIQRGNLPEALKSYRDSLAIADRLAKSDPGNAGWQRDLSVSFNKVGDVLVAQGNLPETLFAPGTRDR